MEGALQKMSSRSTQMTNHRGSEPWLLLGISALGAIAATWSIYFYWLWVVEKPSGGDSDQNGFNSQASSGNTIYFPWEAVRTRRVDMDATGRQERPRKGD